MFSRLVMPRFVLFAVLGAPLLAGCGGSSVAAKDSWTDPNPLPQDTMTVRVAEAGVHGGRFVLAATSSPKTFNATLSNESSTNDVTTRLFTSLVDWDYETREIYGVLARTFETSDDGLQYTFHLRRGACFSDGHPITSEDVMFMAQVTLDTAVGVSLRASLQSGGQPFAFSAPDPYTVVVRLAHPHRLALASIGSMRILPKHRLEAAYRAGEYPAAYGTNTPPESLVTSGAWRVKSFRSGEETVLERNSYWFQVDPRGNRLPYLDEIVFVVVPDQAAAALKFQSGEVDGLENVKNEDYKTFEDGQAQGNYTLYNLGTSLNSAFLWFNLNTVHEAKAGRRVGSPWIDPVRFAWFSNLDFRRAVSLAIDREALIRGPLFGDGVKNWTMITEANPVWKVEGLRKDDYNPDEARRLLAGLGWKDRNGDGILEDERGRTISFTVKTNGDNLIRMGMLGLIKDDLAKVGIELIQSGVDFNTLTTNIRADFQYEAILLGLGSAVPPDPALGMNFWRPSGVSHYWHVKQPKPANALEARFDSLADAHIASLDPARALETYRELCALVNDNELVVWLPSQVVKVPVRNRFGNFVPNIVPHRLLWNIERVFVKPKRNRA